MSKWRLILLGSLLAIPPLILIGAGAFYFWKEKLWFIVWWPMAACLAAAYCLGWWWQRKSRLLPPIDFKPQFHWTDRDREAWRLVEARALRAKEVPIERFTQMPYYVE